MAGSQLRSHVATLTTLADHDLTALWRQVSNAVEARQALHDVLPAVVDHYGAAAGTVAAEWYDALRDKLGVPGTFSAIPAEVPDAGRTGALANWAVVTATSNDMILQLALGGTQRIIANVARETVSGSSIADPQAVGWQRQGSGECAFCAMLVSRGAVYSESTADFASHDHCHCVAVPAFGGHPQPVKPYTPSKRRVSDADRARLRKYLKANY